MFSCWVPKGPLSIAFSGGSDSVFVAEFFLRERRDLTLIHINHGTSASGEMESFVRDWCYDKPVKLDVQYINPERPQGVSWEEHWRNERLAFFHSVDGPVVTGHNLDDAVETYLFNCFNGSPRLMPNKNGNVIRPFLFMTKDEMRAKIKSKWFEDPSNRDPKYSRNRIRHFIVPEVKKVNPGINTVVKRKMIECEYPTK